MNLKLAGTSTEIDVSLKSFRARYESGIEWKPIGNVWHAIDNGLDSSRWSSVVSFWATPTETYALQQLLNLATARGQSFELLCETYEPVFGVEINHSTMIPVCVTSLGEVATGTFVGAPIEWTVELKPLICLRTRYVYSTATLPSSGLYIQTITRDEAPQHAVVELELSRDNFGFGHRQRSASVGFTAPRDVVARAKAFFMQKRTQDFDFVTTLPNWLFDKTVATSRVYALSVEDDGVEDMACLDASFTVVFGEK
jgi:hypothetical protein